MGVGLCTAVCSARIIHASLSPHTCAHSTPLLCTLLLNVLPVADDLVVRALVVPVALLVPLQELIELREAELLRRIVRAVEAEDPLPLVQPRLRVAVEQELEARREELKRRQKAAFAEAAARMRARG